MPQFILNLSAFSSLSFESLAVYIDPGSGLSAIGAFLAIVASLGLSIVGFFWYPIKKLLGKTKDDQEPKPGMDEEND